MQKWLHVNSKSGEAPALDSSNIVDFDCILFKGRLQFISENFKVVIFEFFISDVDHLYRIKHGLVLCCIGKLLILFKAKLGQFCMKEGVFAPIMIR